MAVIYFSRQIPQEREGRECRKEPTPMMPLVVCVLAVGVAMALVQVSWASPIVWGAILLVVVATLRNRAEEAEEMAVKEASARQEAFQEPAPLDEGQPERPLRKTARADRRFKGDHLWGLN